MKNRSKKKLILVLGMTMCLFLPEVHTKAASANLTSDVFDANYYYSAYPDLQATIGNNPSALLDHYIKHGMAEGRNGTATFNASYYKNNYTDLSALFGNDYVAYCYHYMNYGKNEGRNASSSVGTATVTITTEVAGTSIVVPQTPVETTTNVTGTVLGTYTTSYDATVPRATNIAVAVSRINGVVVQPGASFSFSQTVLPRTTANGYVVAPVYLNKKVSKGVGGGICQVSSTLYSAMIVAGIPATERHPHSLPVSYLPSGWDATISGNSKDLKFTNIYDYPIVIYASTNGGNGTVTVSLLKQ